METDFRNITVVDIEAKAVAEALDLGIQDAMASYGLHKRSAEQGGLTRGVLEKAIQYAINKRIERLMRETPDA